jgi:class 3 adenylate cyclase/predicted ATPase
MDVGGWLRGLGLGQYETNFRDNKINAELLPRLTNDDLKDIGVSALGDRLQLLDAIAALAGAKPAADVRASQPGPPLPKGPAVSAERRPITIMFCDLVGSTSLAAKLDAEDWRNLVNAYLDEATKAVTGLGGHVLKKLGDGLMALFGYPHAQENDAERAVRAALAIQRALVARNASKGAPELSARIGLDSGQVVVDAMGEVFGEAPNIAARVQSAAEPGSILITAAVQRQTAGLFVAEDRGQHELKGVSTPLTLYRVVRASGGGRRGGARALTPLVGREEELDLLARRWDRARQGDGQLALIVGEPGLGKSRLMTEFHARLGEIPHTWVEWSSSQLLQNTPLHPISEWGRQRFGADLSAEQRLADLENTLGLIGLNPTEYTPLLAPVVDVPLPEDRAAKLAPEELRRRQLAAMTAWILAAARTQAVVLAFEDLHWADPTSLDLMRALAERGAQAPLLVIATARPEFRPPWSVRSHHSVISLSPLNRIQIGKMVGELSAHHALPRDIVEGVSERTGGVPLFVEEVTRLLLERGEQGGAQAIPPTLQQSLASRLDRLGAARETAQIGAVLGRGFSYALLQSVAGLDEGALHSALERLTQADILFVEGDGPQANYRFKHALIQDAAYDSLLKSRRQALHARAAEILSESASPEPEAIAYHFTQAGLDDLAIEWWGKAGDQALRRSAFQEAISHLGKAIAMADKGGGDAAGAAPIGQRLKLQTNYARAIAWSRGYAAVETKAAIARAQELVSGNDNIAERLNAYYVPIATKLVNGEVNQALTIALTFLRESTAEGGLPDIVAAHRLSGLVYLFLGALQDARMHLEEAIRIYDPDWNSATKCRHGLDSGISATGYLAHVCWQFGEFARARELIDQATARADDLGHIPTLANVRFFKAMLGMFRDDAESALRDADALFEIATSNGLALYLIEGKIYRAWGRARLGDPEAARAEMRDALAKRTEAGVRAGKPHLLGKLAELDAECQSVDEATALISEGLATAGETGEHRTDALLHRIRGDILLKADPENRARAEEAYLAAISIARERGARSFGLQAALKLAKLYQSTTRPAEAHAVLAPALEGFSPTPEMPEIAQAQALLAELSQTAEAKGAAAQRRRLTQLHVARGNALFSARGFGAPETSEAFSRALESASGDRNAPGRLAADYGFWVGSLTRGDLPSMRAHAADFLNDVEARPDSPEAGVAHRVAGATCWVAGEYHEARDHLERALALFQPGRDDDLAFRFGIDPGAGAMAYLAMASWSLGEVDRAISFIDRMQTRMADLTHVGTLALGRERTALFELMRGDRTRAAANAVELARLAREHELPMWGSFGLFLEGWATPAGGGPGGGLDGMRRGVEQLRQQNVLLFDGLLKIALAEAEAGAGDLDHAIVILEEALTTCDRIGYRAFEAELYRVRGGILLKRDPANSAPAEDAFKRAIGVAKHQGTRSFGLRAALALAKLYQSTARPAEGYAVLAPALEGFSPTPEMPEIAEAQTLLVTLAETEEVKADAMRRQQRRQLHVAYGNALIAARGFGAPETIEAFAKARDSAYGEKDAPERFAADYGLWVGSFIRGELSQMRAHAETFLVDVEAKPDSPEAGVAQRSVGVVHWFAGEYREARDHLERALALFRPGRDDDLAFRFGWDAGVGATLYLAFVLWPMGDVERAVSLVRDAQARIAGLSHIGTHANGNMHAALFELMRGGLSHAALSAAELARMAREHDLPMWRAFGFFLVGVATAEGGRPGEALTDMRRGLELLREQDVRVFDGLGKIALAEAEARAGEIDRAIAVLDEAQATCERIGHRAFEAELHRARGELLLQREPTNPAPAEEALRSAIAVARRQGTRSFELRAALSLAKLYRSINRAAEARAVLAPALEGFPLTPEMPEIDEAQALLAALAATDEIRAAAAQQRRLTQLHVAYGNALIAARGYGAPETTEAFARARESAAGDKDAPGRLSADYGLWVGSFTRGDLPSMRAHLADFLNDVETRPDSPETGVAHRVAGATCWFAGEYREAPAHLERALALFQPGRDDDLAFRFGQDQGVSAMAYLALVLWPPGEIDRAALLISRILARMASLTHGNTIALGHMFVAQFALMRGGPMRGNASSLELGRIASAHDLAQFRAFGMFFDGWARVESDLLGGLDGMRRGVDSLRTQNILIFDGLVKIALAKTEAEAGDPGRAVAILDEALTTADRVGHRTFEAELHRARGDILWKRDSADSAPAEEAFLAAIAIAKQQGARSFELRAALALAKLYQSIARPADAYAVLTPALEGFSPTPEMPEIGEGQALLTFGAGHA